MADRLPVGPAEVLNRRRGAAFLLDGRRVQAYEGDTIGSALAAAGIRVTARSFKYHRPRGLFCMSGSCPNCLMTVDGVPNVRACLEPVRPGMKVLRQNAWPNANIDVASVLDAFSFMMPPGFYYKIFHRPKFLWPLVEPMIRRAAGLGKVPRNVPRGHVEKVHLHTDVLVVGGGPAGLAAASEAAAAGARTLLMDAGSRPGGHLLWAIAADAADGMESPGHIAAAHLRAEAESAGVRVLSSTCAFGIFDGRMVAAFDAGHLYRIRSRQTVFATGAHEQPAVFPNNDLPGIMVAGAVDRLLHLYGVLPGRRAVVAAYGPEAYRTADSLARAGARVTVLDSLEGADGGRSSRDATESGADVISGATLVRADGRRALRSVAFLTRNGRQTLQCDLLVIGGIKAPATGLIAQAGAEFTFDERVQAFVASRTPEGVQVAGEATGAQQLETILAQGRLAGLRAAGGLGLGDGGTGDRIEALAPVARGESEKVAMPPLTGGGKGKQFACFCMDVTEKELSTAVKEGFDSIELLKRYTTVSMGPCQGKACLTSSTRLCAQATGQGVGQAGFTTARPPWTPVPLEVLAGGALTRYKQTPMHQWHVDAGAEFMWAGEWRRPHHYTDPAKEVLAVHEGAGIIDVSTLGKIRMQGPDAVELLERLYPSRFEDLPAGKLRYGVMLNDQGVILDDGTVCRLGKDEFFVTTTTGGTEAMVRWIGWWLADWQMDVRILNVTGAYSAVNLAGPKSRAIMQRLTDLDVSAEGLPYVHFARGAVAGVQAMILRLGFVGELGYEVHFPSAFGRYMWDSIIAAGEEFGIAPFGLEAQRILRLEKQHILVGQDTDALSDPYGAGLGWMVKLDKQDFLGRRALADTRTAAPEERLVGLRIQGSTVPPEGSAIVDGGQPVGRLTSSRWSDAAHGVIGMGWVPSAFAEEGRPVELLVDGHVVGGAVAMKPFYDPQGKRLRS